MLLPTLSANPVFTARPWTLCALALAIGSAYAQGSPETSAEPSKDEAPRLQSPKLDESVAEPQKIVVTAQKRLQVAQAVPVSLYSLSGDNIERSGITSLAELGNTVAGVTIGASNPGALAINIRGVTDLANNLQSTNANGLYLDEAPLGGLPSAQPETSMWDIERVEVLRGPQGTLFGEGSMGGTIRVITRKPDASAFFGRVSLGASQISGGGVGHSAKASVNVPLVADRLAMTVAVGQEKLAGWVDIPDLRMKDANDGTKTDGRVALRWRPSRQLTLDASWVYGRVEAGESGATSPGVQDPIAVLPGAAPVNQRSSNTRTTHLGNVTFDYDFGSVSLVSATTLYTYDWNLNKDISYIVPVFFGALGANGKGVTDTLNSVKALTQELRLSSNGDHALDWTVGLYYRDGENTNHGGYRFDLPAWPTGELLDNGISKSVSKAKAEAVFGDVDYAFIDSLSLQAGLRYYREEKTYSMLNETSSVVFRTTAGAFQSGDTTGTATSPKLGLSWKASKDVLVFAKVSKGFRGGGVNTLANPAAYPSVPSGFGPEYLVSSELGVKASTPGGWYVNAYLYRNDWKDLQLGFVTPDGLFGYVDNAGKAKADGGELEIGGRLFAGFTVGLNVAVVDARITEDVTQQVTRSTGVITQVIAQKGNRIPLSSRTKFGLNADYGFSLSESLRGQVTGRYRQASDNYSEASNRPGERNEASKQLYLRAAVRSGAWEAGLWGDNLLNRDDTSYRARPITSIPLVFNTYARPRTFGVDYRSSF